MPVDESQQTKFNAAIAALERIDEIKKHLHISNSNNDYLAIYKHLVDYYLELEAVFNETDQKAQEKRWDQIKNVYNKILNDRSKKKPISNNDINEFYLWWRELNRLEQSYGLLHPKKADQRYAMDEH